MEGYKRPFLILALAAVLGGLGWAPLLAQGANGESAQDPLLDTLNAEFRAQYQQALAATLAQAGPVILEEGDDLILVRKSARTRALIKPVEYHELKAVAHIPLALFVMLSTPREATLSSSRREVLRRYLQLMEKARETLPGRHFTPDQLTRQQMIFSASLELLAGVLADGRINRQKLRSFTKGMGPLLLANVADAAGVELRQLYATLAAWRKDLSPEEWDALHVVMIGPHMPRDGEISIQFFERLFHEPVEGRRVIYAEALWKEQEALNLLATHVLDESAGDSFFGDPLRMHRDLLSDAARAYLDAHPVEP